MGSTFELIAWMPGPVELIVIGVIGLLIFGKRLPEVGKSLGKSIVEFKKGLRGIEDDMDKSVNDQADMLPPPTPDESSGGTSGDASASQADPDPEDTA